eukprot:TRINITY_DN11410_c0_g1_i1.p1 TRINITY_DN11410_c0_g1~~TRINITY_DN11410_c0_g1_i1.p1  ORF type:complete len:138 (-),score=53.85 TRINITY_DN11410_c0_g1_i1:85-498(-)
MNSKYSQKSIDSPSTSVESMDLVHPERETTPKVERRRVEIVQWNPESLFSIDNQHSFDGRREEVPKRRKLKKNRDHLRTESPCQSTDSGYESDDSSDAEDDLPVSTRRYPSNLDQNPSHSLFGEDDGNQIKLRKETM